MKDDRTTSLINRSIDNELGAEEKLQLTALLADSQAARDYLAQMQHIDQLLNGLPDAQPPPELAKTIGDAIVLPNPAAKSKAPANQHWRFAARYGIAASVGLMLAVTWSVTHDSAVNELDQNIMTGTMGTHQSARAQMVDSVTVNMPGLRGEVQLLLRDDVPVLAITVHSDEQIDLSVDFAASNYRPGAMSRLTSQLDSFSTTGARVYARSHGEQHFELTLNKNEQHYRSDEKAVIRLIFTRNGQLVFEDELRLGD